jgi:D-inositol-3-phosphate glycosyltransferase
MSTPLRIALISEQLSPLSITGGIDAGGPNTQLAHLATSLAKAGHQVDVLTRRDTPDLPPVVHLFPGARVIHIPAGPAALVPKDKLSSHMPEFTRACERLLRDGPTYDVMHAHFFLSGLVAQRLKESTNTPFVIPLQALGLVRPHHGLEAQTLPIARTEVEHALIQRADAVIAHSPQDEIDLKLYGARPRKLAMVPCGFDPTEFRPMNRGKAREALGLPDKAFVILHLGRLVARKGIDNIIRSLAHLDPNIPVRLLVVGGETREPDELATPEIARLRQLARDVGVFDKVSFVGHRQRHELRTFYAACDVFATTPWYEPMGITPLEAMACGRPVLASAVGSLQHSVVNGATGFLVPPHKPEALAERLTQLHHHPTQAEEMGMAGLRRMRALFTWERVADQLTHLYRSVRLGDRPTTLPRLHQMHAQAVETY